jgi:hypothetical protein
MEETTIDRAAMRRLAKALVSSAAQIIRLRLPCRRPPRGVPSETSRMRTLFLRLKPGDRRAALAVLDD